MLRWPHRRIPIFDIHNWTAYIALGLIFLHPILLLCSRTAGFSIGDILLPVWSPKQTLYNCLGAATFYCVIFVVVTSYFRAKLGSRLWKKLHYVAYAAATFLFVHGILIDPNLKNQPPDLLDGEKVLVEICAFLIVAATFGASATSRRSAPLPRRSERSITKFLLEASRGRRCWCGSPASPGAQPFQDRINTADQAENNKSRSWSI